MAIKTIPLSRLEADLNKTLNECADSGQTFACLQLEVSGVGRKIQGQPAQTVWHGGTGRMTLADRG